MKSREPPPTTLREVATNVSSPRRNGPVHGAAIRPPTMPIANAPRKPRPPTWLSRACHDASAPAPALGEPPLPRRRQVELERAEHRCCERGEQQDDRDHHERVGEDR